MSAPITIPRAVMAGPARSRPELHDSSSPGRQVYAGCGAGEVAGMANKLDQDPGRQRRCSRRISQRPDASRSPTPTLPIVRPTSAVRREGGCAARQLQFPAGVRPPKDEPPLPANPVALAMLGRNKADNPSLTSRISATEAIGFRPDESGQYRPEPSLEVNMALTNCKLLICLLFLSVSTLAEAESDEQCPDACKAGLTFHAVRPHR
jgi:hypothetical protein